MKRIFNLLFIGLLTLTSAFADELNSEQTELRDDLYNFIKEEGYVPEIDSDGDVRFKVEGTTYYFHVSSSDTNPFYVTFFSEYSYQDNYTKEQLIIASQNLNLYKGVKLVIMDGSFRICAELFLRNAEPMKTAFYKLHKQMSLLEGDIIDECAKAASASGFLSASSAPFSVSGMEVANVENDNTIISDYGSTIYDYKTKYLKLKFTAKPNRTGTFKVYLKLYRGSELTTGSSSPEGYSTSTTITFSDTQTKTVYMPGWGSTTAGHWKAETYRYEIWDDNNHCLGTKTFTVY